MGLRRECHRKCRLVERYQPLLLLEYSNSWRTLLKGTIVIIHTGHYASDSGEEEEIMQSNSLAVRQSLG